MGGVKFTKYSFKPHPALHIVKRSKFILHRFLQPFTKVIACNNDIFYPNKITITWI